MSINHPTEAGLLCLFFSSLCIICLPIHLVDAQFKPLDGILSGKVPISQSVIRATLPVPGSGEKRAEPHVHHPSPPGPAAAAPDRQGAGLR